MLTGVGFLNAQMVQVMVCTLEMPMHIKFSAFRLDEKVNRPQKKFFPQKYLSLYSSKFEGNKYGRVKLLGRVLKKSGEILRRVLKKVGKVRVGLNKIELKFSRGKMLITSEKLSHLSPTFFTLIRYLFDECQKIKSSLC